MPVNKSKSQKTAWFHCASLGEFEQGKPLMKVLKQHHYFIVVTFFSPSGYLPKKTDKDIDLAAYLPFDGYFNAQKTIKHIKPDIAIWVKYDFWYFYLKHLHKLQIPVYLISAHFRPEQLFFKWYGSFYRNLLTNFKIIFCQTPSSVKLLQNFHQKVVFSGDTRYDNVVARSRQLNCHPAIEKFCRNADFVLIAGSTYPPEEKLIYEALRLLKGKIKIIVAPHFVLPERINAIKKLFQNFRFEVLSLIAEPKPDTDVLIIDTIGHLAAAYQHATVAFIGGGFKQGNLHNILEPAVFGLPVCFGSAIERFPEALALIELQAANKITNLNDLIAFINRYLQNKSLLVEMRKTIHDFVLSQQGATEKIANEILQAEK